MNRQLYLAAYDIEDDRRLRLALKLVREFAIGGQKSVHECHLTAAERNDMSEAFDLLIADGGRFLLLRLDPRVKVFTLGRAVAPRDPAVFYIA